MLGDLQQKDMQTIDVKVAPILPATPDFCNMQNRCIVVSFVVVD